MKRRSKGATVAIALAAGAPAVARGQFIGANFAGSNIDQLATAVIPPDTMGAVGDRYYTEFINGRFAVYRKSDGGLVSATTDAAFWANAGVNLAGADLSDPRILFDHASRRWFAAQIDLPAPEGAVTNNFLLAVSNSADPTGGWTGLKIHSDSTNSLFAD